MSWWLEDTASAQRDHPAPPTRPQLPSPAPDQARARRAAEAWGWVCVGRGSRGERHPPKPAGAAQESCHPLTGGSDPPPLLPVRARAAAEIVPEHPPHLFTTHQGLPSSPPAPAMPVQMWPQGPAVFGDSECTNPWSNTTFSSRVSKSKTKKRVH